MSKMGQLNSYHALLKTTASEDILSIPIEALELSEPIMRVLRNSRVYENGVARQKIATVGDMLKTKLDGLEVMFGYGSRNPAIVNQYCFEVEEKLAALGLRFSDSEFTVGEVRVPVEAFSEETQKFLKKYATRVRTIDDLALLNPSKYARMSVGINLSAVLRELEAFIEAYGMKIEGCPRRYERDYAFPLDKYKKYLSPETKEQRCGKALHSYEVDERNTKNPNRFVPGTAAERQPAVKSELATIGLNRTILDVLSVSKIYTIDDLVARGGELKHKLNASNRYIIMRALARLDKKIDGMDYEVVNGQIARYPVKGEKFAIPTAIAHFNAGKLDETAFDEFMQTRVADFGFDECVAQPLVNNGVQTLDDLVKLSREELLTKLGGDRSKLWYVMDSMFKYHVEAAHGKQADRFVDVDHFANIHADTATDKELTALLLNPDLTEVGFTELAAAQLHNLGIHNLFDLCRTTRSELIEKTGSTQLCEAARRVRSQYGLKSVVANITQRKSALLNSEKEYKVDVKTLSLEDRERLMTAPLTEVGFSELYATNMAEALGVKNLRDLCSLSGGEINRAFTPNYLNFTCRILSNYGLKLTPWKVRKHALAQPQTPNGEDSLGDE